jgi:leucyl/phenylalanyl-tRNA--protein transferase
LTVYQIPDEQLIFPHPSEANPDGLLGIGADLNPARLLLAYQNGIFPWYSAGEPIHWWCLTPRLILIPDEIKISKSMRSYLNGSKFQYSFDKEFLAVMLECKTVSRQNQNGSWIHQEVIEAFIELHRLGFAHSVEVWENENLVGGLYGLSIGKMFCGESMFAKKSNASKYALIQLTNVLIQKQFLFIDCQQDTMHLKTMGARLVNKEGFFKLLEENKKYPLQPENWNNIKKM